MLTYPTFREELIAVGRRLAERGLIAGTDGNVSVRLDDGRILVTPSGVNKGRLTEDELVVVDPAGRWVEGSGAPSSELAMHLFAYAKRDDVRAVVHAHPPHATAFAVTGIPLPGDVLPEVVLCTGNIALAPYAPPGTEAVPRALKPLIAEHDALLMQNHGLLTLGRNLEEAYNRHETVEHFASIYWLALQLGTPATIPPDDLERLKGLRRTLLGR